jgi:protein TonB
MTVALLLPQTRPEPPPPAGKPRALKVPVSKPAPAKPQRAPTPDPKPSAPAIEATTSAVAPTAAAPAATSAAPSPGPSSATATGLSGQGEARDTISKARFDADYLHNPAPPYPPQARRMSEEGKVILRVEVSAEGRAENVEIKTSSGSARLDESALRTVRSWRFVPAKRGETAIASWVLVPIIFKLEH